MQRLVLVIATVLLYSPSCISQTSGTAAIDRAIAVNNLTLADSLLSVYTFELIQSKQADSLLAYLFYAGRIAEKKSGVEAAINTVISFIKKVESLDNNPVTLRSAYIEAGEYYGSLGKNKLAYNANEKALAYTQKIAGKHPSLQGKIESNLGAYAQRMSNVNLSKQHHRRALQLYLSDAKTDYEQLQITYNSIGSIMWYASKTDSALYFFGKSLEALSKTPRTPVNQFYRPAILQNNISALYGAQGKTTQAIAAMKASIGYLKQFLADKEPNPKKVTATTFQFETTDNLAGIYKELGDYKQARALLEYSYYQKQKTLDAKDPAIFISKILLGQLYYSLREYDKAQQYLLNGSKEIELSDGDYLFWQADAASTLALLYQQKKDFAKAALYFERADSLYDKSLQGDYDNIYLDFLRTASLFYADRNMGRQAFAKAQKSYAYIIKNQGLQTLEAFYQLLTLSQVAYQLQQYKEAKNYSITALSTVNKMVGASTNMLDSIKVELRKPRALLFKSKATYALMGHATEQQLLQLLPDLNEALGILERRKTMLSDPQNVTLLMADEGALLEFIKQINLQLYQQTKRTVYLDQVISLHESGIYNRIRARLDKNDTLQFLRVPIAVRNKEKELKTAVGAALDGNGTHDQKMQRYFVAIDRWNAFAKTLQQNYGSYYRMRYASIVQSASMLQQAIAADQTVVRYLFSNGRLYAMVIGRQQKSIVELSVQNLETLVEAVSATNNNAQQTGRVLHDLYRQLWAPIEALVNTRKVTAVPDGILYHLNFELLTPEPIRYYSELATKSLLAKHTFSYHYSLLLLDEKQPNTFNDNFIAFAPGFIGDQSKPNRPGAIDPLEKDVQYLSLLPQPFTLQLISKIQRLMGGNLYLNNTSTKETFIKNAGQHGIIHIGTHAESNNDNPQLSKLIFAKNKQEDLNNALYVHEIYNCDLQSDLAVLTACETGKPGYQDGEGMVSLAHAFNYAGSNSILTGLWKIDEQSSAIIMEDFYKNLLKGLPKDEALQQAKIKFLKQGEGRMLAPQYWGGLIIMGNTAALPLKTRGLYGTLALALVLIFMLGCLLVLRNRKRLQAVQQ